MMYFYKHHFVNVAFALLFLGLYLNFKNVIFKKITTDNTLGHTRMQTAAF